MIAARLTSIYSSVLLELYFNPSVGYASLAGITLPSKVVMSKKKIKNLFTLVKSMFRKSYT